jgi:hypothetical protein
MVAMQRLPEAMEGWTGSSGLGDVDGMVEEVTGVQ